MCGFVGLASINTQVDHAWLSTANNTLIHRGPDDSGEWSSDDGLVGLAHRRLSILDLSPLGRQPMHLRERGLSVVFNGEIYNFSNLRRELEKLGHSFHSATDTEVLLLSYAQWGEAFVTKLNGMFAFAIFDSPRQRLLLARDRAGEKPVFYRRDGGVLYFASELKALLAHPALPRQIDHEALDCYLAMGFVPGERCILTGYRKLPAAHILSFDLRKGSMEVRCYWKIPDLQVGDCVDEASLVCELEELLEDAVARQLVADVPVGVLLSGGVDSSLITAMAVRRSNKVRTFSIGFPGHGNLDETPHARLIAQHYCTEHVVFNAEPTSADLLPILARQFDEPLVDSSMFSTWLVSYLVRQHCTVALGGDGGDELFGGYDHYSRLLWMKRRLPLLPNWLRRVISKTAECYLPMGTKGRNYLLSLDVDLTSSLPLIANYFDATHRKYLMNGQPNYLIVAETIRSSRIPIQSDLIQRATRMDFQNYLTDDILVKVDRASMLNSLEVRAPFLDHRIIEFAFGRVPSHLKVSERDKKILLKRLAARLLPPEFDIKRKRGFSIPLNQWLKTGLFRDLFWDTLTSRDCIFNVFTVNSLLRGQDRGQNNGERLFALVQFELWRKAYGSSL